MDDMEHTTVERAARQAGGARARLREALAARPGWRGLPTQYLPAAMEWRAAAYDARGGLNASRLSATGVSEEQAMGRLAALLVAPA